MAHDRQSRRDYGLGFQVKVLAIFQVVPSSLGSSPIHCPVSMKIKYFKDEEEISFNLLNRVIAQVVGPGGTQYRCHATEGSV